MARLKPCPCYKAPRLCADEEFFRRLWSQALEIGHIYSKERIRRLTATDSHSSDKERPMNGAQFHLSWVGFDGGRLLQNFEILCVGRVFPQAVEPDVVLLYLRHE